MLICHIIMCLSSFLIKVDIANISNKETKVNKGIIESKINSKEYIVGFKDELFKYKGKVSKDSNNIIYVDYNQKRDLEDRDIIDVEKVNPEYVKLLRPGYEKDKIFTSIFGKIRYIEVKNPKDKNENIKQIYIFFHGKGNPRIINRHLGVNDWKFGGNFNRIKNLVILNHMSYISVDFPDFYNKGPSIITEFIKYLKGKYKNAKIILVGASSGGEILWNIFDKTKGKYIDGIILMGSIPYPRNIKNIISWGNPIYITHGSKDKNISYKSLIFFYKRILKYNKKYKIKLIIFKNGVHGTPIRMTDWKDVLLFFK